MALSLAQVSAVSGVSRDVVNKWMAREILRTPIPPTQNGVARAYTRENALEIAFTAAQVLLGRDPVFAAYEAREWMAQEARGTLHTYWAYNPARDDRHWIGGQPFTQLMDFDRLADLGVLQDRPLEPDGEHRPARALGIINRQAIVADIDEMISANAVRA